ncbi:hypothetical protein B0T25DRAFT_164316 [Lasiosphaeria hispida]|uniref:Apple domain-containing protein n=1 Tax=Lasiosphaeria hispida TaxID=260671 RepID=A0AAJ0HMJ1_9PEZI|nr:hypothetical protein B0T25DRAFT_164316 [Lasiosphaeria hispida]
MDPKRVYADPSGQGIELSNRPDYQEFHNPGLEVLPPSAPEVVTPTSPPPPPQTWEKAGGYGYPPPTAHSTVAPPYDYAKGAFDRQVLAHPPNPIDPSSEERRIMGIKRQTFWILIAVGVFLAVAAIAAGVGVGVATHKSNDAPAPASTTTSVANTTSTRTLPLPTAQATIGPSSTIQCPANNLTLYTASSDRSKRFVLLCGRDYNSGAGTVDMYNQNSSSMNDCIDACAGALGCVGAGWGNYNGRYVCWLKSLLATPQGSAAWYFAALDNETDAEVAGLPTVAPSKEERRGG